MQRQQSKFQARKQRTSSIAIRVWLRVFVVSVVLQALWLYIATARMPVAWQMNSPIHQLASLIDAPRRDTNKATGRSQTATDTTRRALEQKSVVTTPSADQQIEAALANAGATSVEPANTVNNASIETQPQTCTGPVYIKPGALNPVGLSDGLTSVVDTPTYYRVYGSSLSQLRRAVEMCPTRKAAGSFHASTAHQITWSYATTSSAYGCSVNHVKVGLHVNQLMPLYVATVDTPDSVASYWNTYAANLKTHEDGHAAIDVRYAAELTTALQNMQNVPCDVISRQAQSTIDSYVTMLNTANELYDSQTGHGATQGAIL